MNNNRLIVIISTIFTSLISLPRVLFFLSNKKDSPLNNFLDVTIEDLITRTLLLFSFSFLVLTFNITWIKNFSNRSKLWVSIAINLLILAVWVGFFQLIDKFFFNIYDSVLSPKLNTITYFFFLVVLILASKVITLINKSKQDAIEKEILKQKSIQNELEALKNQINPHFLFNSFNTLSLLVREDQNEAGKFINKLSFLFRSILQSQEKEFVTVKEELKVVDSYIHLIRERYKENFIVDINISQQLYAKNLPTLALQLLVENAVKHNEISQRNPLHVEIFDENNWIVVKNNLKERTGSIESTNLGLKSLNTRAKLKIGKEIKIERDHQFFTVKIPTL